MAELVVLYWRDIPSQVVAKAGRRSAKAELSPRFMVAIDQAAMRAGAHGGDAYLEAWRRGDPSSCADDLDAAVAATVESLERAYPPERLRRLVENGGREGERP